MEASCPQITHNLRCQPPSLVLCGAGFQTEALPKGPWGCCVETGCRRKGGDQDTLVGDQDTFQESGEVSAKERRMSQVLRFFYWQSLQALTMSAVRKGGGPAASRLAFSQQDGRCAVYWDVCVWTRVCAFLISYLACGKLDRLKMNLFRCSWGHLSIRIECTCCLHRLWLMRKRKETPSEPQSPFSFTIAVMEKELNHCT